MSSHGRMRRDDRRFHPPPPRNKRKAAESKKDRKTVNRSDNDYHPLPPLICTQRKMVAWERLAPRPEFILFSLG